MNGSGRSVRTNLPPLTVEMERKKPSCNLLHTSSFNACPREIRMLLPQAMKQGERTEALAARQYGL